MSQLAPLSAPSQDLPSLIDRAASMLSGAKTAAEVLEAREVAGLAYDVAKRAARLQRAKSARDDLVAAAHRAQAHALEIEAQAKRRLADEYDAAQARGEVAGHGGGRNFKVADSNVETTTADLGLRRDEIHEARQIRDAEAADPGVVRRALDDRLERGEEPTRAALRKLVVDAAMRGLRPVGRAIRPSETGRLTQNASPNGLRLSSSAPRPPLDGKKSHSIPMGCRVHGFALFAKYSGDGDRHESAGRPEGRLRGGRSPSQAAALEASENPAGSL